MEAKTEIQNTINAGQIGLNIQLHPLIVMNASEHWTRNKAQNNPPIQAVGALIGKQADRTIEILNSFELRYDIIDTNIIIDKDYLSFKESHFKQVFPDLELLGWYSAGFQSLNTDIGIHKQICDVYENSIMMKLNTHTKNNELPISFHESIIDFEHGEAKVIFRDIPYQLTTEEAERVGLEHIVSNNYCFSDKTSYESMVTSHLQAQQNAIKMLNSRLKIIIEYMKGVSQGELAIDYDIQREISCLLNRLPILTGEDFKTNFLMEGNDVAILAYLGTITKTCDTMNQFINKFNSLHDKQAASRRMRGLLF